MRNPPAWFILLVGTAILAVRRPDQMVNPQLWAEDGIFFFQAREIGPAAIGLELAGYLQLAPRLIAALATLVDPARVPQVFVGGAVALTLYVMARALSPRCPLPSRAWCALALVIVPDASEVILHAGNIQWILAVGFVLLVISREPTKPLEQANDFGAAVLFGLSGPFSLIMTPLFLWRAAQRRTRASIGLAMIVAACAAVQATSIARHPQPVAADAVFDAKALLMFPGLRIAAGPLIGPALTAKLSPAAAMAFTAFGIGGVIALAAAPGANRHERLMLGTALGALLVSTIYRCWHSLPILCLPGQATRYVFPLQVILVWLFLARARDATPPWRRAMIALTAWILGMSVPQLRQPALPDMRWADYASKLRAGEEVTIPINPPGWTFTFLAHPPQ